MTVSICLRDLDAELVEVDRHVLRWQPDLETAQGVSFLCPKCFIHEAEPHRIVCWFRDRDVPDEWEPGPARWTVFGTGLDNLSLMAKVEITGRCDARFRIINGCVTELV